MPKMPNHLTIKNFLKPVGSAVSLAPLFESLLRRYNKVKRKISMEVYKDKNSYIFKIKIPSEKNGMYENDIFYDVVLEFYPIGDELDSKRINEYGIRTFSNCPTYLYNFCYIYSKMGAIINKIPKTMYDEKALSQKPGVTNPYRMIGPEKSIWFAIRKIYDETLYKKSKLDNLVLEHESYEDIFSDVSSQEEKMKEIRDNSIIKKEKKSKSKKGFINKTKDDLQKMSRNIFKNNLKKEKKESNLSKNKLKTKSLKGGMKKNKSLFSPIIKNKKLVNKK